MNDRLDELLARLPSDPPAPDLTARIVAAVAHRRRSRARWRQVGVAALACAFVGIALTARSWPEAAGVLTPTLTVPDADALNQTVDTFFSSPLESLAALVSAALAWETALAEGIGVVFLLGIVLLAAGAFGGLARLLQRASLLNGYSH